MSKKTKTGKRASGNPARRAAQQSVAGATTFWNSFLTRVPLHAPYAQLWEETGIYPFEAWFYVGGRSFIIEEVQAGRSPDLKRWFDHVMTFDPRLAFTNHKQLLYSFGYELNGQVRPECGSQVESVEYLYKENLHNFTREQHVTTAKLGTQALQTLRAVDEVFFKLMVEER